MNYIKITFNFMFIYLTIRRICDYVLYYVRYYWQLANVLR